MRRLPPRMAWLCSCWFLRPTCVATVVVLAAGVAGVSGCFAPDPGYELILVAGQSNAVGFETAVADLPGHAADADIALFFDAGDPGFDDGVYDSSSLGQWMTLGAQPRGNPTLGSRQYGNYANADGGFGPEISLARDLHDAGIAHVAVVKFAYNGTSFQDNDWQAGEPLYLALLDRLAAARAALEAEGRAVHLRALVWIQGESDSGSTTYAADLTAFIEALRDDTGERELPVFLGLKTDFAVSTGVVVTAQQQVAAADPDVVYVDTVGAEAASRAHFSSMGTLEVGRRFAEALLPRLRNATP